VLAASFWTGPPTNTTAQGPALSELANSLFTRWAIPFEIASLVLLVALIGAIVIARTGNGGDG
jgi:NADH:ubiquinone oxidoreductase subunit 6 (subunit J)